MTKSVTDAAQEVRHGERPRKQPAHFNDFVCYGAQINNPVSLATPLQKGSLGTQYPITNYVTCANFPTFHQNYLAAITMVVEPRFYSVAIKDPHWQKAMTEEIKALEKNATWEIVDLPPGKKPISCKWVYRVEYNSDDTIRRYKARLVICGDNQIEVFDFNETLAPVAKITSVHCFLAVAVARRWELHQMDVNNVFLHGDLEEEVYMKMPPGFSSSGPNKVCRLHKSLYGLCQTPQQWFCQTFLQTMGIRFCSFIRRLLFVCLLEGRSIYGRIGIH